MKTRKISTAIFAIWVQFGYCDLIYFIFADYTRRQKLITSIFLTAIIKIRRFGMIFNEAVHFSRGTK